MKIREIRFEDLEQVYDLLNQLNSVETSQVDKELAWKNFNSEGLVLEHEGKIVGYGSLLVEYKIRGYNSGQIEDIVIDESYRGLGWGELLVERLVERGDSMGCYRISLFCNKKLIPFYSKNGFKQNNVVMKRWKE